MRDFSGVRGQGSGASGVSGVGGASGIELRSMGIWGGRVAAPELYRGRVKVGRVLL